jgi:hypothetical protein
MRKKVMGVCDKQEAGFEERGDGVCDKQETSVLGKMKMKKK